MNRIHHFFTYIDESKWNKFIFLTFAILLKIIIFSIVFVLDNPQNLNLFIDFGGDTSEYMGACEKLYTQGIYIVDTLYGFSDKAFRMPGLTFIYIPLRFFVSKENTMNGIIVFQVLCSGIATYYLSRLAKNIFGGKKIFYVVFIFANLGFGLMSYNNILLTESLACSFLIFSFYLLEKAVRENKTIDFLYSGLFMTWLIFLRPYFIVVFIFAIFLLLYFLYVKKTAKKSLMLFVFIFCIVETIWVARNFISIGKFIPLQTSANFIASKPTCERAKFKFITTLGLNYEWWTKNTESAWFNNPKQVLNIPIPSNKIIPTIAFNDGLTIDSLILARDYMHKVQNQEVEDKSKLTYFNYHSERIFNKFISAYKENQLIDFLLFSRVRLVKSFLSDNYYWPLGKISYPKNMIFIVFDFFSNYYIKIVGFLGLIIITRLFIKDYLKLFLISFVPIFILLLFPIYSGCDEKRFFILSIPFLVISLSYVLVKILDLKKFKYLALFFTFILPILLAVKSTLGLIRF